MHLCFDYVIVLLWIEKNMFYLEKKIGICVFAYELVIGCVLGSKIPSWDCNGRYIFFLLEL